MITQAELKSVMRYCHKTGVFIWRKNPGKNNLKGKQAGSVSGKYANLRISGKSYKAHRLAWLYVYGNMPKGQIDHIDHNSLNNRIDNLRDVSASDNAKNRRITKTNRTKIHGVFWRERLDRFEVSIKIDQKIIYLGVFSHIFDAACARKSAELKFNFHPNHGK